MELRVVEVLHEGAWFTTEFKCLRKGDKFRLFEGEGGEPVRNRQGHTEFICECDAYLNDQGVWTVAIWDGIDESEGVL